MITDYNAFYNHLANQYKRAKEQPWRTRIELHSMLTLIGDLSGKKVVDVACGDGWLTRALRKAGASDVVGIDISEKMIELARWEEARNPLGIEYRLGDARATGPQEDFDLSVSNWLLVYAHNREELGAFCRGLARGVKPGGRMVTLLTNPDLYTWQECPPNYRKYGFEARLPEFPYEGAAVLLTLLLEGESIAIENYYLPHEAYASALSEAGFREITFHNVTLAPDPKAGDEGDYWDHFLQYPLMIMIDGIRE